MLQNVLQKCLRVVKTFALVYLSIDLMHDNNAIYEEKKKQTQNQKQYQQKKPPNQICVYIYILFVLCLCINKINKKIKEIGTVKKSMNRTTKLLVERTMLKMQVIWHSVLQETHEVLKCQFFWRYRRLVKKWYNAYTFLQVLFKKHLEFN